MAVTQSQFEALITDKVQQDGWEVSRGLITDVMKAQAEVAHGLIAKGEPVPLRDLCKIKPVYKPKQPKRTGMFFGEERTVAARPASVVLKATFLKAAKNAVPTGRRVAAVFGSAEPAPQAAPKSRPAAVTPTVRASPRRLGARSKPDPVKAARRGR
jgi:hypothetical protein